MLSADFFTVGRIRALAPAASITIAEPAAASFNIHASAFGIITPIRAAALMAQLAVESDGFTRLEENLNYSHAERIAAVWHRLASRSSELVHNPAALANAAYANHNGNGDEASGDGARFLGRGLIQITGRTNYAGASGAAGADLLADPAAASDPAIAAKIALWFWQTNGCNEHADRDDIDGITRIINGSAMAGAYIRRALTQKAKGIFV
jgi:putative chitinase